MTSSLDAPAFAQEILKARDTAVAVEPFSARVPGFTLADGYAVDACVHQLRQARGERMVGRKIGFSNPKAWERLGVNAPAWARMYAHTVVLPDAADDVSGLNMARAKLDLAGMLIPRIEPEIVVHFRSAPDLTQGVQGVLDAIDWLATGFEIVQSNYVGAATAADSIANSVHHGALLVGPKVMVKDLPHGVAQRLEQFTLVLSRDGEVVEQGTGGNVLGSPLKSVLALGEVLAGQSYGSIEAGEIITTGTVTTAHPVSPGQTWRLAVDGIELPGLELTFN